MSNFVSYANAEALMTAIGQKFSALGGAYIAKGSVAFASLPALSADVLNFVYNVTDEFTTTSDFVEGAGKKYSAGTNVVIVDASTVAYNEVTPVGTENPKEEGWYVLEGASYVLTTDESVESGTTYYERVVTAIYKYDVLGNFIDVDGIENEIEAVAAMITGTFDASTAYSTGDVVIYDGALYKFTADHAAGAWDASEVDETTVVELISAAEPDALTTAQVNDLIALLG